MAGVASSERSELFNPIQQRSVKHQDHHFQSNGLVAAFALLRSSLVIAEEGLAIRSFYHHFRFPDLPIALRNIGIALACLFALGGCGGPEFTYRYRLTIEVETPQGLKTGSSVIETTLQNNHNVRWAPMEARLFTSRVRGEAVFVDLGEGKHVIALLAMGRTAQEDVDFRTIVPGSLGVRWWQPDEVLPALARAIERREKVEVPRKLLPTLVRFRNLNDPRTAELVDPDYFQNAYGSGFLFRGATVELVPIGWWPANAIGLSGAAITREIELKLPWWVQSGRPASLARRSWLAGGSSGAAMEPERLFVRR